MTLPTTHVTDAQKLAGQGFVDLFEIEMLSGNRFFFKNDERLFWQGKTYEGWACQLTGVETNAEEQESRPQLVIANRVDTDTGVFSPFIESGLLDRARVTRRRILRSAAVANTPLAQIHSWYVSRIATVNRDIIALELRSATEGTLFNVPARKFMPPDFPTVSLR